MLRAWILVVALAELVGFALPAVVGVLTAASSTAVALAALVVAGAVEGTVLGAGQVAVLRRALPAVSVSRWVGATAGAAALAYLLALLPSAAASVVAGWPVPVVVGVGAVLGVLVLLVIGAAQWLELRRHVVGAATWIGVTALAWLLGLGVFLAAATPLWHPGQPLVVAVVIGLGAGALMAVAMAAVTGVGLVRLLARAGRDAGTVGVPFGPGGDGMPPRESSGSPLREGERS
ncbi:hypothetical protein ACFPK1_16375 [Actinomycetospora rhizophila]|uniref:Uncharacterized protein n=1 Tax=Actinomycetospora rhizophila TaxID=1416876 RepID=A0ABV9ZDZ6_9PSEU